MAKAKRPAWQSATLFIMGVLLIAGNVAVEVAGALRGHEAHTMWAVIGHIVTLGIGVLFLMPERFFRLLAHVPLPEKWRRGE